MRKTERKRTTGRERKQKRNRDKRERDSEREREEHRKGDRQMKAKPKYENLGKSYVQYTRKTLQEIKEMRLSGHILTTARLATLWVVASRYHTLHSL